MNRDAVGISSLQSAGGERSPAAPDLPSQLDSVLGELESLRDELSVLRRRDETLKFYMQRLDEELRLAAKLQRDFLPKTLPQIGRVRFDVLYRPAGYVSGDLYDVARLDEKHVGFCMADAVGHGMPAALLTMFIKQALVAKEIIPGGYRLLKPSQVLARLNDALLDQHLSQATFATAIYGLINTETLVVTFACGGHPSPLLLGADGNLQTVEGDGALLGIFPQEQYADHSVQLSPGDRLILYTDGVEVAFSTDDAVDSAQWRARLFDRRSLGTEQLFQDFATHLDAESGSLQPKDDLTIIVVEVQR